MTDATPGPQTSHPQSPVLQAIADDLGVTIVGHRVLGESVSGGGHLTGHELELQHPDGTTQKQVVYLEASPPSEAREGVLVFRDDESDEEVAAWLYPRDPALPALPMAVYPDAAAVLLGRLGFDTTGLRLELVAYRPGRRAVIRVDTTDATYFLKVVPPKTVEKVDHLHSLWRSHDLPSPPVLGRTSDGLLVLATLPGTPSSSVLTELGEGFLDGIEQLMARIGAIPGSEAARRSLAERVSWYERMLTGRVPALTADIRAVRRRVDELIAAAPPARPVTVHGDLHVGQLFVDPVNPEYIIGVLDIDTAGVGDPADDAAALYAHLIVTVLFQRRREALREARAADRLAASWLGRWARHPDPGFESRARAIAATHLIAHALGDTGGEAELVSHALDLVGGRTA